MVDAALDATGRCEESEGFPVAVVQRTVLRRFEQHVDDRNAQVPLNSLDEVGDGAARDGDHISVGFL